MSEDDITLAGELALGLLQGDDRTAALRRMLADPAFARQVERWRRELDGLNDEWVEAEPSIAVTRRILAMSERATVAAGWRMLATISSLAAAALLVLLLARPQLAPSPSPAPVAAPSKLTLVAVLAPKDAAAVAIVFDPARHTARVAGAVGVPPGRVAELWLIGSDGVPQAAGLLDRTMAGQIPLRPSLVPIAGVTLALSIEPTGGSPKPTPTGPVIATGPLVAVPIDNG